MRLFVVSLGIVALLAGSAAGQVFKPRSGAKLAPTATLEKDGTIKTKQKSGFKRKAKATPEAEVEDVTIDDDDEAKRGPARKPARAERDDDSEMEAEDSSSAKREAVRKKSKRWDRNFVLITDDDE